MSGRDGPTADAPAALFREEQRFRQTWLLALIVGVAGMLIGLASYGLVVHFGFGRPFGREPLTGPQLVAMASVMIAVGVGLVWLLSSAKLATTVTAEALSVRFTPFHRKPRIYTANDIESAQARTYRPLAEYGGWGIRLGRAGHAYNVSGDRGVQLHLKGGKRLLIGSQRADELEAALARMCGRGPG